MGIVLKKNVFPTRLKLSEQIKLNQQKTKMRDIIHQKSLNLLKDFEHSTKTIIF